MGLSAMPFAIGQVQDAGLIFLSHMASNVATHHNAILFNNNDDDKDENNANGLHDQQNQDNQQEPADPTVALLSTAVVLLGLSTACLGLLLVVVGRARLAKFVAYLPMPVIRYSILDRNDNIVRAFVLGSFFFFFFFSVVRFFFWGRGFFFFFCFFFFFFFFSVVRRVYSGQSYMSFPCFMLFILLTKARSFQCFFFFSFFYFDSFPSYLYSGYLAFIGFFCIEAGMSLCTSQPLTSLDDWLDLVSDQHSLVSVRNNILPLYFLISFAFAECNIYQTLCRIMLLQLT